ncbi:MAG: TetR/AcrR family transcriptional regulator [Chitinophagaceae bacterium]|nr:TetR/AcrR family transcriptional regulator [Chitinophagaceae bacterium]
MGISERRIRQKEEVRSNILCTAWQMVKDEGWQSLSIRKIADAIEYSVPVIYDHFENKEAILMEIGKEGFKSLAKKMQQAKAKSTDPAGQLRVMADAYWHFAQKNKEYYQLMFGLGMPCCDVEKNLPEKMTVRSLFMDSINELIAKHQTPNANLCLKYHTLCSILHGLISIRMLSNSDASDTLNKLVLDDAINGFIKNLES